MPAIPNTGVTPARPATAAVRPRYNPAEVIEGARPARLRSVAVSVAAGAAVALVFGAKPLNDWVSALPISDVTDHLSAWAQSWQDALDQAGPGRLFDGLQALFRWFHALHF